MQGRRLSTHHRTALLPNAISDDKYMKDARNYLMQLHDCFFEAFEYEMSSTFEKIREIIFEMKHLCWCGGSAVQSLFHSSEITTSLQRLVRTTSSQPLINEIIQFIGVVCRNNRAIQDVLCNVGWIRTLASFLFSNEESTRKWACCSLFYLLLNNASSQKEALSIAKLRVNLEKVKNENWKYWEHNDADEVLKMLS